MDYQKAVERVYEHLEEDRVESAVMGCLRIARAAKDYLNAAIFLRELYPNKKEVVDAFYDDIAPLKKEARDYVFNHSLERWLDLHTVEGLNFDSNDEYKSDGDKRNVLSIGAGELDGELQQWERAIGDMTLPQGMGQFDTAAFTDSMLREKSMMRLRIKAVQTIKARLKTRCLNYALQMERQLGLQRKSQSFLESAQSEVNNFYKSHAEDVFTKLQKAAQLAVSSDIEDCSLLLTEVRRALKAAADFHYPPAAGKVRCMDGTERLMGEEQFLNRLHEFVAMRFAKATSKELLQAELDHLTVFLRRLNDVASKGVHGSVTFAEAKQGLIGLYFFLFNLCQHLTHEKDGLISVTVTAE